MRVVIIHNLYPPYARGGAEQVVFKTVQGLSEAGHQVVVITLGPDGEEVEKQGQVTIYRITPKNIFSYTNAHQHSAVGRIFWHIFDTFNLSSAKRIETILKEEQPDIVHTHNLMGLGFLIPRVIQKLKIIHVHTVHDVQLVEPSGIILKQKEHAWRYTGFFTKLYAFIMRSLLNSPNVVISPSLFLLQFYERWGFFKHSKRMVLRNPVTLHTTEITKKSDNTFRFLYIGQIENHKGVLFLIDTFQAVLQKYNLPVELHIVGNGSKMEEMFEKIKTDVRMKVHGKVDHKELPAIFEQMDVTVVPSLCYENSPTVIFESFSYTTPVLASNIEGIAELIREGENGFTFKAGNSESLQEKLLWCVDHKEELKNMGEKGKQGIVPLSKEEYLKRLLELYNEIEVEK